MIIWQTVIISIDPFLIEWRHFSAIQNFNPNGPGEGGTAVKIPPELEEKKKSMFKENQFNLLASNMISVNRTLKGAFFNAFFTWKSGSSIWWERC